jgi:hypothetical protein
MRLVILLILAIASGAAAWAQALAPARFLEGTLGDADYMIQIPAGWNGGGLVVYAHGYEGEGPGPGTVRAPGIAGYFEQRGIAWAATGFRAKGYRPSGSPAISGCPSAWHQAPRTCWCSAPSARPAIAV